MENVNIINTQNHLQELYYVEPLLMAYQHKIHILDEQLRQLREDSDSLLKFGEDIVTENNFLRKQLESKNQFILKSEQVGLNAHFLKLDNENLIEKSKILKQKNDFLLKKLQQLGQNSERDKINMARPNVNLNQTMKQLRTQRQKLKNYQLEVIDLQKKLEITNNQLSNERSILKQHERKNFQLENEIIKLKNQLKINKQQHQSYQISHEGTTSNQELEIQNLKSQLSAIQRRESQLFAKNMLLQTEIQDKNAKSHNLSLQNTQLQTNNNNILQMLQTYESKVNTQTKKIKQLEGDLKDYNQVSVSQRKQTELLQWKLSEKEKETEQKEGQWKKQRQRIAKMWEERFQTLKKAIYEEKQDLYDEIQGLKTDKTKHDVGRR